jgi:hypothetical protein
MTEQTIEELGAKRIQLIGYVEELLVMHTNMY